MQLMQPLKVIGKFSEDFKDSSVADATVQGYWKVFCGALLQPKDKSSERKKDLARHGETWWKMKMLITKLKKYQNLERAEIRKQKYGKVIWCKEKG